jgi:hypothetical protein
VGAAALQSEVYQNRFARSFVHRRLLSSETKRHLIQDESKHVVWAFACSTEQREQTTAFRRTQKVDGADQ